MSHEPSTITSEFAIPVKVHNLVLRIQREFLDPLRARLALAATQRDAETGATHATRVAAEAGFAQITADRKEQAGVVERDVAKSLQTIKVLCGDADAFLQQCRLDATEPSQGDPSQSDISSISARLKNLKERKQASYWPKSVEGRWGVGIGSAVLMYVFVPLVLVWPAIVYAWRMHWDSDIRMWHAQIAGDARLLSQRLSEEVESARSSAKSAIEKARKTKLDPALAAAAAADQATLARFEEAQRKIEVDAIAPSSALMADVAEVWTEASFAGADWQAKDWQRWTPHDSPEFGARIGTLTLDVEDIQTLLPAVNLRFALPALVPFSSGQCLLLEAAGPARQAAADALQSVLMRVLATTPPGKGRFTFVDPVELGHNVADFMALGDFDKELIGGKVWTEPRHINEQLSELTEHMETVIQKYLRKEFESILAYNERAQEVAEPFRFLVVFDFPVNFTDESARRLVSIVRNGPRCGVFTFVARDSSKPLPYGFAIDDLNQVANRITWDGSGTPRWQDPVFGAGTLLTTDAIAPFPDLARNIISQSGELATRAMKVEVPFEKLLAAAGLTSETLWRASSAASLKVPIGPTGARRLQYMTLGEGLAHHALIVGRTGSGKTNLMHVIISALAMSYSPEELQLYLVDFKGGVGFKPYATSELPHAAVIAIESEREFGISVLSGLDATLRERFELFRKAGVDNLADYRARKPDERLPRILLIVDEYQEFFSPQDDAIAQQAKMILDRIVRQGRSFGIHILLGTQSLAGNAQLPTSTLGQMAVRIALPCNEADARAIFSEDNRAARSLTRPGEAIYNSAAGLIEGNNPFQVALFSDTDLQRSLEAIAQQPVDPHRRKPVVFEGNEPAALEHSAPLAAILLDKRWTSPASGRAWLGEPVAMLPAVHSVFDRKPGRHLLIVDRDEAQGLGVLHAAWLSLLCQHRPTTARFYVLDLATAETPWATMAASYRSAFDHQIEFLSRHTLPDVLTDLVRTIQQVDAHAQRALPPVYFLVQGLHRAKDLRWSPELSYSKSQGGPTPPEQFATILKDGPEANIHVMAWCDTATNARRAVDRHMPEFGLRVAGAMSIEDSNALLDAPDAARLNRPHRLLFFDEERPGIIQKFRPYALPDMGWVKTIASGQRQWES